MSGAISALYVAAHPQGGGAMAEAIEATAAGIETRLVTSPAAALEAVREDGVDCVVAEAGLAEGGDRSLLERLGQHHGTVPVIAVSSGAAAGREALSNGADDCVRLDAWSEPAAILARRIEAICGATPAGDGWLVETGDDGAADGSRDARDLDRFERIIRGVGDILYATDADGQYTYVNPASARITGYSVDELLGKGPQLVFDEDDVETFDGAIEGLLREDGGDVARVEATLRTKDGDTVPIESTLTLRYDGDGAFAGSLGVARDISARKARERELREYETIVRALPDGVAILDTEGYLTRFIPPTGTDRGVGGYRPAELQGEHVSTVMSDESFERGAELIEELVTTDRERRVFEIEIIGKDGETYLREDHLALLEADDGSIEGTVGVLRDIEERKAYERELERQNARLEAFAEIASHDLRNPLNVAHGYLEIARTEGDEEALERVADALERMDRLIDDTLTMARQGEAVSERTAVDVGTLARECWEAVRVDGATLTVTDAVAVQGDQDRLRRVLENLLRNAVEHGGEEVTVEIGALEEGGFYVADDGPGIPVAERDSIFEAGFSADDGTGFGLAIIDEIVEAHGWDVSVREGEAGGARFEIAVGADTA